MVGDRTCIESSNSGSVLTISGVLPLDVGNYTIFVQTQRGLGQHTIVLSINGARINPTLISNGQAVDYFFKILNLFLRSTGTPRFVSIRVPAYSQYFSSVLERTELRRRFTNHRLRSRDEKFRSS